MKMRRTVYLPDDLLVEILSRVPAKSLTRLRSTSKRWNALVKDGILAKKHSANAPRDSSLVLMVTDFRVHLVSVDLHENVSPSAKVTSQFSLKDPLLELQVDVRNAYHSDGLLVCITSDNRLVVWNPCTGETKWIQARNMCKETDCYALGYDNKSSCYKILSINRLQFYLFDIVNFNKPEVYDFASNSWRNVCSTTEWFIPRQRSRGMSVKGTTYWLAVRYPYDDCFLLSFGFSTERFQRLSLPADAPSSLFKMALSVTREEQKLCMLSTFPLDEESKSYVWIATKVESTGALSWSKFHRLHLRIRMSVGLKTMLHIVGEDKYIHEDDPERNSTCPLLLTYVPSLVQIQQGFRDHDSAITVLEADLTALKRGLTEAVGLRGSIISHYTAIMIRFLDW